MLSLDDERWSELEGGYRRPVDVRPLLRELEAGSDVNATWRALWDELYHQGDVGEASFAVIPHLVHIYQARGAADWNMYAFAAVVDLARGTDHNIDVPEWMAPDYNDALRRLGRLALDELPHATQHELVRSILAFLALFHGARVYARILMEFSEEELLELVRSTN